MVLRDSIWAIIMFIFMPILILLVYLLALSENHHYRIVGGGKVYELHGSQFRENAYGGITINEGDKRIILNEYSIERMD